ncbi:HEAT repeat domain-containing protein [Mycoavidus sp. HKI]|uniref:HEAT repeat domain-containing protein n=1 Tax=Mycoavidus sp. HKI TaxID=2840467 RepID=UPI001CBE5545|nr:HEAT repeat domain-containing protein [Mycoavidus sp. HKI]UAW63919.1 HEAT repeat domain-containing protein [Mycoavidus sp. HKI]
MEKAEIELEENPGNSQAKRVVDEIRAGSLTLLNELPLNGHPISLSVQAKNTQVDYLFEKALSTLGSLELPNKPSLFLVYAHDNPPYGKAEAAISRYLIDKLSQIRVNLYSDQTPMGQPPSRAVEDCMEDGKLDDILTSQLCLLPARLRDDIEPVDKVVVCCSEVLENYLEWPHYGEFCQELREAYRKDCEQKGTSAIREVVNAFSQGEEYKAEFHHVLTEMAFLQIRAEQLTEQHGIIPISLTPKSAKQCLGGFIASTTVRMEDISRFEEQAKAGRDVYLNQGQHVVLFKLIERLLVGSDEAQTFLNKFWQGYDKCIFRLNKESSTPDELEFTKLVDSIFDDIDRELRSQLVHVLQQHKNIVGKLRLPSLLELRDALYQHYQRSNLSIQRVSGQTTSLRNCYINLAIVESQAQREEDKKELEKQAATFERLPSSERQQLEATNPNRLIALEKLFEAQKLRNGSEGVPKRILIQGRAGIGKTTLCKKLVYEYHQNGLWQDQFESVLWVPLRELKTHAPKRLEDLLCTQYFVGYESRPAQALSKVFYAHQDKTLFILDGLDEVIGELNEGRPLKDFLRMLLNQAHVVITSRPAGVNAKLLGQFDLELETIGFSTANVQAYIGKCVPESNQAAIQQFIYRTPLIRGLVNIPIQLDALCYSWDRLPQNQEVTMAMLYEAMVDKLWRKDSVRLEKEEDGKVLGVDVIEDLSESDLEELMTAEIHYLGYLAFKGLETEKIEFSRKELSQRRKELSEWSQTGRKLPLDFTTNLKKTSYLHTADAERLEAERHYHFLHLTFQEFFAAKFLVGHLRAYSESTARSVSSEATHAKLGLMLSPDALKIFVAEHKYNPRYEIVWSMVAGLLTGGALQHFFALLEKTPRDLIGGRHQQVIMGCLSEARSQLHETKITELEQAFMKWLHFEMKWNENGLSELGRQTIFPEHLLLKSLTQSESKKKQIVQTLGVRSILSEEAICDLINLLWDENGEVQDVAVQALSKQKTLSKNAVSNLNQALQSSNQRARAAAAKVLEAHDISSDPTILKLINGLKDEDTKVRNEAAKALSEQENLPKEAILALTETLKDGYSDIRLEAVLALSRQQALPENTISILVHLLQDESLRVRLEAIDVLKGQKILTEAAISVLSNLIKESDEFIKGRAIYALGSRNELSGAMIFALTDVLRDEKEKFKVMAANELGTQKNLPEATISALIDMIIQAQTKSTKLAALDVLGKQNTLSEAAIFALSKLSEDTDDEDIKFLVAQVSGSQNTLSAAAISALSAELKHKDHSIRYDAANNLKEQKALPEEAIAALIGTLEDESTMIRASAVDALIQQNALTERIISALAKALLILCKEKEFETLALNLGVKLYTSQVIFRQRTLSESTSAVLLRILQQVDNESVRFMFALALAVHNTLPEAVLSILITTLQKNNKEALKNTVLSALMSYDSLPEAGVSVLIAALQDPSEEIRTVATNTLYKQTVLNENAISELRNILKNENGSINLTVLSILRKEKNLPETTILTLIDTLQSNDKVIRDVAMGTLKHQESLPETAISSLVKVLQGGNRDAKQVTAAVLGGQKTLKKEVVSALSSTLQYNDEDVRHMVIKALGEQESLPEDAVFALTELLLRDQDVLNKLAAIKVLENQKTLLETVISTLSLALINDQDWRVRAASARVLRVQNTLSQSAIRVLIQALHDTHKEVRSSSIWALSWHLNELYSLFPSLEFKELQIICTKVLFPHSCKQIAPLVIQNNQLHFYTAIGLGQPIKLNSEQSIVIIKALKAIRSEADLPLLPEEERFLIEE